MSFCQGLKLPLNCSARHKITDEDRLQCMYVMLMIVVLSWSFCWEKKRDPVGTKRMKTF